MKIALQAVALLLALGTFLPLVRKDTWMIRGWDFPRLQLFFFGIATLAGLFFAGIDINSVDWVPLVLLATATASLAAWMWPYTRFAGRQVSSSAGNDPSITLLVSNVLMSNRESEKLIDLARSRMPDVLVALETDRWWTDELAKLHETHPHCVEVPQEDTYGMVLRSRLPLIDPRIEHLIQEHIPSIHFSVELGSGDRVQLHAIHPKPPFPDEDDTSTDRDAELLVVAKRVSGHDGPVIVLGDLNDVAWSHTTTLFQKVSGLLDPRIGRGFFSTFHAGHWWMRWPLDHVFVSRHFRVHSIERLRSIGSDHFPMFAALTYEPEKRSEQPKPATNGAEEREVARKIAKAGDS